VRVIDEMPGNAASLVVGMHREAVHVAAPAVERHDQTAGNASLNFREEEPCRRTVGQQRRDVLLHAAP